MSGGENLEIISALPFFRKKAQQSYHREHDLLYSKLLITCSCHFLTNHIAYDFDHVLVEILNLNRYFKLPKGKI